MGILPDTELKRIIEDKEAVRVEEGPEIDLETQIGPSSVDLRLGYEFGTLETRKIKAIDTRKMGKYSDIKDSRNVSADEGIVVHPGEFLLGSTLETLKVPDNMVARIEGRSSYARLGLIPHTAAGFVDAGFEGKITLEIQNLGNVPITIYPEERFCQAAFEEMTKPAGTPYGEKKDSKYQGQRGATASRLEEEDR